MKFVVQASGVLAVLLPDLLHHLPEERLLRFLLAILGDRDDVRVGRNVSIGADEEAGAEGDCLNVEGCGPITWRLKQDLPAAPSMMRTTAGLLYIARRSPSDTALTTKVRCVGSSVATIKKAPVATKSSLRIEKAPWG